MKWEDRGKGRGNILHSYHGVWLLGFLAVRSGIFFFVGEAVWHGMIHSLDRWILFLNGCLFLLLAWLAGGWLMYIWLQ